MRIYETHLVEWDANVLQCATGFVLSKQHVLLSYCDSNAEVNSTA
jgi:hypothetical protein